ncbi:MAG: hypothetical protein AAF997_12580 [Myxococcota bacterium]
MIRTHWNTILALGAIMLATASTQCGQGADPDRGILADAQPVRSPRVGNPQVVTDGRALRDGRPWDYEPSAKFQSRGSFVEYDLGESRPIGAIWILADHNDGFLIELSDDGDAYATVWEVPPVAGRGFRPRFQGALEGKGRFLRITPSSGDDRYAISEVRVYDSPRAEPPDVPRVSGYVHGRTLRSQTLLFGLALIVWLLLSVSRTPVWWKLITAAWPIYAGFGFLSALIQDWPAGGREVSLVRGVVGVVAAGAVALEAFGTKLRPTRGVVIAVLGVCGVTAFMAFYNLGQPQFFDHEDRDHTFAHYLDLRQYYTTAKYFDEIGYSGIYAADMAAYLENVPRSSIRRLGKSPMRDLHTLRLSTVADQEAAIREAPSWFSDERWEEYKRDTEFFRRKMGDRSYRETLIDMGGNATPVWLSTAHLMFNAIEPSNEAFVWTGLLDPLLVIIAFLAIAYAFGMRTMLVCMIVFGANDFIMYGSNWGGATLRHDWMVYLAFGLCALKRERFMLGGAFFAASAMIRAFPALALLGTALPVAWWLLDYRRREGSFPSLSTVMTEQRPFVRIVAGAAVGVLVLLTFSIIVLPADAWLVWIKKVGQLSSGTHANHVSLRLLVAGAESAYRTLNERMPLFVMGILAMVALVIAGARRATPVQSALVGLMLIPAVFYPANYYSHFVWLLPMLAVESSANDRPLRAADALLWMALLLMCGVQYFTVLAPDRVVHFWMEAAIQFGTFLTILLVWLSRERINALQLRPGFADA